MAGKTKSTRFPPDLSDVAELRAKQLGYPNWNSYLKGLVRYDALVQGNHQVTLPWAQMRPEEQDKVDAELLQLTRKGVGKRGQYLQHLLERMRTAEEAEERPTNRNANGNGKPKLRVLDGR